jgi:hypothetical protein
VLEDSHLTALLGDDREDICGNALWLLDNDGWVVDSRKRRVVWVPSDLRAFLALPPTQSIIADGGYFKLQLDKIQVGEDWVNCYRA